MADIGSFGTSNIHCSFYLCKDPNLFKINLDSKNVATIQKIRVWSGKYIDAIQINDGPKFGGHGGTLHEFSLGNNETIYTILGRAGNRVDYLSIETSNGRIFDFGGGNGGDPFSVNLSGSVSFGILGIQGRTIDGIKILGYYNY
jgi:hypothetical protein